MNRCQFLLAVGGIALIAGCASTDKQAAVPDDDKEYVTGSRLPVKSGTGNTGVVSDRNSIDSMMQKRSIAPGGTGN
jgi:hypothetical protein